MKLPPPSWFEPHPYFTFPINSAAIEGADAALTTDDRLMLYALVCGRCPERYLEVGTYKGGSALIGCAAMDSMGLSSKMVCIDPDTDQIPAETKTKLYKASENGNRASILQGTAPDLIPVAIQMLGGSCDFLFLDASHTYENTYETLREVDSFLEEDAWLLCHDANNPDVARAIDQYAAHIHIVDFGVVTRKSYLQYGGLRLLKKV